MCTPIFDFTDKTIMAGWIGVIGALIGALVTLVCVYKTLKNQQHVRDEDKKDLLIGLCQIIHTDITNLREIDERGLGKLLKELKAGEPIKGVMPVEQDYLVIYKANANLIGQLPDSELRLAIVSTYVQIAGLLDSVTQNNKTNNELDKLTIENSGHLSIDNTKAINVLNNILSNYADKLKTTHTLVEHKTADLLVKLDNYIEEHTKHGNKGWWRWR